MNVRRSNLTQKRLLESLGKEFNLLLNKTLNVSLVSKKFVRKTIKVVTPLITHDKYLSE